MNLNGRKTAISLAVKKKTFIDYEMVKRLLSVFNISQSMADKLFTLSNVFLIIGAALVLIGTVGAIWTSGILGRFADERISNNEVKTAKAIADASLAQAASEKAKGEAAIANQRTAEFEVKSQQTLLELERERVARLKLEEKLRPRNITQEERQKLLGLLANGPKGRVFVVPKTFDEEAEEYAAQIKTVLKDSGYAVEEWKRRRPFSFGRSGAFMWVKDFSNPPVHAAHIQHAFKEIGVTLDGYGNTDVVPDQDTVVIAVGAKP